MSRPADGPTNARDARVAFSVRPCRPHDRDALRALGQPPEVAAALCPSILTRVAWALGGFEARGFVAEETRGGLAIGGVQFVRARRSSGTWMFGHWRVAPGYRRRGVGRLLLGEGVRRLPGLRRLFSYVDWGNDGSIQAHLRLGFEAAAEIEGRAPLGGLSTVGPAAPSVRLVPASRRDGSALADLYRKAMGPLWLRLFPDDQRSFSPELGTGLGGPALPLLRLLREGRARTFIVRADGPPAGFAVWRGGAGTVALYMDPGVCEGALLAKTAVQLMSLGIPRTLEIVVHGLPPPVLAPRTPIAARILMALPEPALLTGR